MMRPAVDLLRNQFVVVTQRVDHGTIFVRRTAVGFSSIDEMKATFEEINGVLDTAGRAHLSLVVDTRAAPPRNDSAFEAAFGPLRLRMLTGFRRVGILVATPVGKLQVERHAREDGLKVRAFTQEEEAVSFCSSR